MSDDVWKTPRRIGNRIAFCLRTRCRVKTRGLRTGLCWKPSTGSSHQPVNDHPIRGDIARVSYAHILTPISSHAALGSGDLHRWWWGSRRQAHPSLFVPLQFHCQPPCQPDGKHQSGTNTVSRLSARKPGAHSAYIPCRYRTGEAFQCP